MFDRAWDILDRASEFAATSFPAHGVEALPWSKITVVMALTLVVGTLAAIRCAIIEPACREAKRVLGLPFRSWGVRNEGREAIQLNTTEKSS